MSPSKDEYLIQSYPKMIMTELKRNPSIHQTIFDYFER